MNKERTARSLPGIATFLVLLAAAIVLLGLMIWYIAEVLVRPARSVGIAELAGFTLIVVAFVAVCVGFAGLTPVNPNEARALVFVGHYAGTLRAQGLHWVNPFTVRRRISVRVRNFETSKLKVNDHDGNPIEIAAIVVWKVTDTAEALFEVDDYENFVHVQAESALRNLAMTHPYDAHVEGNSPCAPTRSRSPTSCAPRSRTASPKAGVEVIEARISHLAYAPEIANAMLRRQQANAVIAARSRIVEGAVGMVEMALEQLSSKEVVQLDEERKAQMVSNLLVVLCSEHETQPVVNTGTLYA